MLSSSRKLGVVVVLVVLATAASAAADPRIERQAWAYSTRVPTFLAQTGEIYVAATAAAEQARSFVGFTFGDEVHPGAAVTLREAADSTLPDTASIDACPLTDRLDEDGEITSNPPQADCTARAALTRAPDGTWTLPLDGDLGWNVTTTHGIALVPGADASGTWRVGFATDGTGIIDGSSTATRTSDPPAGTNTSGPRAGTSTSEPQGVATSGGQPSEGVAYGLDFAPSLGGLASERVPDTATEAADTGSAGSARVSVGQLNSVGRHYNSASAALAALLLGVGGLVAIATRGVRSRPSRRLPLLLATRPGSGVAAAAICALVSLLPLVGREVIVFKAGVVLIFVVAAIGLHVLVNWAGQLSLAHSVMVGLPAVAVLALSEQHGISPLYLLPVAILLGALVGAIIALPTLRARDLQVAVVTLVAGIALSQYFFAQDWLIPSIGRSAATVRLGPLAMTTSRSLYPLLLILVGATIAAAWILMHSKMGRAFAWIRSDPDAAAAFGVPVVRYQIAAYAIGGGFGGMAGGLTVLWLQRLGPDAFPTTLSFTYLLVAVLAGRGFIGGVAAASIVLSGGPLFAPNIFGADAGKLVQSLIAYGGPIGLIVMLTTYESGLNGLGRNLMNSLNAKLRQLNADEAESERPMSVSAIVGVVLIIAGFVAIWLAWLHASHTAQLWVQNQEILSGGIGGIGLLIVGVGLLIRDRLVQGQALLAQQIELMMRMGQLPVEGTELPDDTTALPDDTVVEPPFVGPTARRRERRPLRVRR